MFSINIIISLLRFVFEELKLIFLFNFSTALSIIFVNFYLTFFGLEKYDFLTLYLVARVSVL